MLKIARCHTRKNTTDIENEVTRLHQNKNNKQSPWKCEVWTPRYPAKQNTTAYPKLDTKPATKFIDKLVVETMHDHATIHIQSVNPRTNSGTTWGEEV